MQVTLDIHENHFRSFMNFINTIDYVEIINIEEPVEKKSDKAYDVNEIRKTYKNAYEPWTEGDDKRLEIFYTGGKTIKELSAIFGRNEGAIISHIKKLELE